MENAAWAVAKWSGHFGKVQIRGIHPLARIAAGRLIPLLINSILESCGRRGIHGEVYQKQSFVRIWLTAFISLEVGILSGLAL